MSVPPALRDALLFQAAWFACVAGGNTGALLALALLLPLQATWPGTRNAREWSVALLFAGVGLAMDLGFQAAGLLRFDDAGVTGVPPWLAVLWLFFAGTLLRSLAFLQGRPVPAAVLGAVGGPLAYIAGEQLGAAHSPHGPVELVLLLAPGWALLLALLAWLTPRLLADTERA